MTMALDAIRRELGTSNKIPAEALRAAVAEAAALAPEIIAIVNRAADGVYLLPRESDLAFYGLHALAAAKHKPLFQPLLRFLMRPDDSAERLLGDAVTASLPQILLSVYDGDLDALRAAIADDAADEFVRWGLFDALTALTLSGVVPRATAFAICARFERERLAGDGSAAWHGWQQAVLAMGFVELAEGLRASWHDGRNPQRDADLAHGEQAVARLATDPAAVSEEWRPRIQPIEDPVEALSWASGFESPPPEDPPSTSLSDQEIAWLAGFLESKHVPRATLPMSIVDGFLTALAAGPAGVDLRDVMLFIWHEPGDIGSGPDYDSPEQKQYAEALIERHAASIAERLAARDGSWPLTRLEIADPQNWAYGFAIGVGAKRDLWAPLLEDRKRSAMVEPMFLLSDPEGAGESEPAMASDELVEALPESVYGIHAYWRNRQLGFASGAPVPAAPKVGRNDPCPCASGKKFKRCCGAGVQ